MTINLAAILDDSSLRLALIYLPNFAWFFAGFIQFCFRPHNWTNGIPREARKTTKADAYHLDLLIYLGAFGGAISLSVLDALRLDWNGTGTGTGTWLLMYLRLWGYAHASQGIVGWSRIKPSKRWKWLSLGPITYVDTVLAVWDLSLAFWY